MIAEKNIRICALVLIGVLSCTCSWDPEVFPKKILMVLCAMPCVLAFRDVIREKKIKITFVKWYGLFLLFVSLSLLYTVNHTDATDVVRRCVLCFGLGFSASQLIKDSSDIKMVMWGMIFGACITLVVALKIESHLIGMGRIGTITCGAATAFSETLLMGLFCLFLLKTKNKIVLILQIILFGGVVLSGSRMPLIISVSAFAVLRLMEVGFTRKIFFTLIGTGAVVVCLGYAVMNNSILYGIVGNRIDSTLDTMKYGVDKRNDSSLKHRSDMKKEALKLWYAAPIAGHGVNSFCELSPVTNKRASSHCGFTEILCSFGVIGFVLFFWPFLNPLICLVRYRKSGESLVLLFCLIMEWQSSDFAASAYVCFCYVLFCQLRFKQTEQKQLA